MDYEIIATLGPSSSEPTLWQSMLSNGVTAFRLNTSHLTLDALTQWLEQYYHFFSTDSYIVPLYLDLQGSKWRLGSFPTCVLDIGQKLQLVCEQSSDDAKTLPVPHSDFFGALPQSNGELVLSDGKIRMQVINTKDNIIIAKVTQAGEIAPHKGITLPTSSYRKETLSLKDQAIIAQTSAYPFLRYALSYVKDALEMKNYRAFLGDSAYLCAKLERTTALEEVLSIADLADELWLCRGDLGAEVGIKAMAEIVHSFSNLLPQLTIPIILAGQVLEHLVSYPNPTRSELCYLYDSLCKGYKGFVLSDETAVGSFVLEACCTAAIFKDEAYCSH